MNVNFCEIGVDELLRVNPGDVNRPLTAEEIMHIASSLEAMWRYDNEAAKLGMHVVTESGSHSNGYFNPNTLILNWNVRCIMADQMVMRLNQVGAPCPDWVVGISDAATELAEEVAAKLKTKLAKMEKRKGQIRLVTPLAFDDQILLVNDSCSTGADFALAVRAVLEKNPNAKVLPHAPVILNRGGMSRIVMEEGVFNVLPLAECRIRDYGVGPGNCPLCTMGSIPINPRESVENRRVLITSQL